MDVEIEYCVPCGHLDRAIDLERRLLSQFGNRLDGVRLRTGTGGVFKVRIDGELLVDAQRDGLDPEQVGDQVGAHLAVS